MEDSGTIAWAGHVFPYKRIDAEWIRVETHRGPFDLGPHGTIRCNLAGLLGTHEQSELDSILEDKENDN